MIVFQYPIKSERLCLGKMRFCFLHIMKWEINVHYEGEPSKLKFVVHLGVAGHLTDSCITLCSGRWNIKRAILLV